MTWTLLTGIVPPSLDLLNTQTETVYKLADQTTAASADTAFWAAAYEVAERCVIVLNDQHDRGQVATPFGILAAADPTEADFGPAWKPWLGRITKLVADIRNGKRGYDIVASIQ